MFVGCMFAGKTTQLIKDFDKHKNNKNVCVINYFHDTRYDPEMLTTHDHIKIPCLRLKTLESILTNKLDNDVFLINEAQFFPDLYNVVTKLADKYNKDVYIYGLDGDFERNDFGDIGKIYPVCTSITKLYANCEICKRQNNACFTHRITNKKEQRIIDSSSYIPVCRKCYLFLNS